MKKTKDMCVKTGSYQSNGETKNRWLTIGALMEDDKGGQFIMMNRSFNPAGVPFKEGSESILISLFDPKQKELSDHSKAKANAYQPDEEVPF